MGQIEPFYSDPHFPPGMVILLGIVAVVGLICVAALRWQRRSQQFQLTRLALEKGMANLPGVPPFWLISLRRGVATLVLGIGLIVIGAAAWQSAQGVPAPNPTTMPSPEPPSASMDDRGQRPPPDAPPDAMRWPPPDWRHMEHGPYMHSRPPMFDPVMDRWSRAQARQTMGLVSIACGFILTLLGAVRIGFSRVERKYTST